VAQQQIPSLLEHPIAFAHRGARAHAPENTLEAFQLAIRLGANGLETDAWITKDGEVVLDHDGTVRVRGFRKPIAELTRSQLPRHIPTLAEMWETCGTAHELSVDIKDDAVTDVLVNIAQQSHFDPRKLWVCHHRHDEVLSIRQRHSDIRVVDSTRLNRLKNGLEMRSAENSQAGVDAINMHFTDWTGGSVTLAHRFGVLAFAWDIQFAHQLENSLTMGLDAVYSDHVDRMVDAYRSYYGRAPLTAES
jgi:glycerophosphoryl diester phosphodiesterase